MDADLTQALARVKGLLDSNTITEAEHAALRIKILGSSFDNTSTAASGKDSDDRMVLTEDGQKRVSFTNERTSKMGPFETPVLTEAVSEFLQSLRSGSLSTTKTEEVRFQTMKELWPEWIHWMSNCSVFPARLPSYALACQVQDFRRVLAELVALMMSIEQRRLAPGRDEVCFGGLVAALMAPKLTFSSVSVDTIKKSKGASVISGLVNIPPPSVSVKDPPPNLFAKDKSAGPKAPQKDKEATPGSRAAALQQGGCTYCKTMSFAFEGHMLADCRKIAYKDAICSICTTKGHTDMVCPKRPRN